MTRTVIGFLSMCVAVAAYAGVNSWTPVGPDGGGARSVAYHPTTPDLVFAVTDKSVYRSADGGQSWTVALEDNSLDLGKIVVDPADPNRALVAGFGTLFRSSDAGASFSFELAPGIIGDLAIAPDGSVLYGIANTSDPSIFISTDFGETWQEQPGTGLLAATFFSEFAIDPQDPNTIYIVYNNNGLFRSTDAGQNWTQQSAFTLIGTSQLAVDPADSTRLLLATRDTGLLSSSDSGVTWTQELTDGYVWAGYHPQAATGEAIAVSLDGAVVRRQGNGMVWETGQTLKLHGVFDGDFDPQNSDPFNSTLMIATEGGPLLTSDGGVSFSALGEGIRSATVTDIEAAQDGSDTLYVAYSAGPMGLYRRSLGVWAPVNNNVLRANVDDPIDILAQIAIAPDDANRLFFTSGDSVVDSIDGGQSWTNAHPYFGANFRFPQAIEIAPSDSRIIYASISDGGVRRSLDQGTTWEAVNTGLPAFIGPIAVDPLDADIVYAGTEPGAGEPALFRTDDGGVTWVPIGTGFDAQVVSSLAVDPLNSATVYAGGTEGSQGLFVSTDSGQTWNRVGLPAGDDPGFSIVVDPIVPTNLVMASDANTAAARSVDGGATWEALPFARLGSVIQRVALDPVNPNVVLAAATNYGLIEFEVSTDLEASILTAPSTLVLDASDTATVQVTNNGPYAASAVTLALDLPPGTSVSDATPAQGSCTISSPSVTCELGALQVGASVDTDITIVGDSMASSGTLTASVSAHESDLDDVNNESAATIESVRTADLGVTLTADNSMIDNGDTVTLTAVASNQGPNDTTAAELTLVLDANLAFVSAAPTQGTCSENAGTVSCQLAAIADGSDATVTVEATATAKGDLTSTASIADSTVLDANGVDDSATVSQTAQPLADISVALAGEPSQAVSGSSVQYRFEVTNDGPDDLDSADLTVEVSGATFNSATMGGSGSCSVSGSSASCTIDSLASGSSEMITVNVTAGGAGSSISVSAEVSFAGADSSSGNDQSSATISVTAPPSSGGGGGAFGVLELMLLGLFMLRRRARRQPVMEI